MASQAALFPCSPWVSLLALVSEALHHIQCFPSHLSKTGTPFLTLKEVCSGPPAP